MYGIKCGDLELTEQAKEEFSAEECDLDFLSCLNYPYLTWATNGEGEYYYGYCPNYPWNISTEEIEFTMDDIEKRIKDVLCQYLTPDSIEKLNFEYIDEEGWG